jgi:YVTN family beta-propeller protein
VGVNPSTGRVYVANVNSNTVSVIDGTTNTVVASSFLSVSPQAGRCWLVDDGYAVIATIKACF